MKALYQTKTIQKGLGKCLHPGGTELTSRLLKRLAITKDSLVLDGGCGFGATLNLLKDYTDHGIGLELDFDFACETSKACFPVIQGDLKNLPFLNNSLDCIISECTWNLTNRSVSVAEFYRVLSPSGKVGIIDIFLQQEDGSKRWPIKSCFNTASSLESTTEVFKKQGFNIVLLENHSQVLHNLAGEFVFAHGSLQNFWQQITGETTKTELVCDCVRQTKPGLFLLIAQK